MSRFIIVFLCFFTLFVSAQSAPAGIVFTSEAQTIAVGAISETLTIQAQDASGSVFKLQSTGCLALSSSASGEFSSSASSWSAVSVLTMNKNSANRNFYYKGTAAGTHTLTAHLVLKPETEERSCANWPIAEWPTGWTATQQMTVGLGADIAEAPAASTTSPESHSGPVNVGTEPVPSLIVKVLGPATVSVGADATFSATVFGVKKEPIPNARVVWSFGNGAVKEGLSVRYGYNIPGSYLVVVDVSSGGLAGSARFAVNARTPEVRVARVAEGVGGFVEIENKSNAELDVSGWGITSNGTLFTIPDRTIILPSATVAFPSEVTKLSLIGNDARLLFPNGTLAAEYSEPPKKLEVAVITPAPPSPAPVRKQEVYPSILQNTEIATTASASIILSVADTTSSSGVGIWLWGVFGICLVGIGAFTAFRLKPPPPEESEEKEFAEKVRIV